MGGGVAGDVDDFTWPEGEELIEELLVASFAWGIDDDGGLGGREGDVLENGFGAGGEEAGVFDPVEIRILLCPVGGGFADFDTQYLFKLVREAEGEEAGAAVGVDEVFGAT